MKREGMNERQGWIDGKNVWGRAHTGLSGEDVLIVKEVLHPCHHVVDVGGRGELHALAVLVDPRVVETSLEGSGIRRMPRSMRMTS